jgi:hypothetical protein
MRKTYVIMGHSFTPLGTHHFGVVPPHITLGHAAKQGESFSRNNIFRHLLWSPIVRENIMNGKISIGNAFRSIAAPGGHLDTWEQKYNLNKMNLERISRNNKQLLFANQIVNLRPDPKLLQGVFELKNRANLEQLKNSNSIAGPRKYRLSRLLQRITHHAGGPAIVYGLYCRHVQGGLNLPNAKMKPIEYGVGKGTVSFPSKAALKRYLTLRPTKSRERVQGGVVKSLGRLLKGKRFQGVSAKRNPRRPK